MSYELIIFADDLTVFSGTAKIGDGRILNSHPATHPTGRIGIGFEIPADAPQGWGCEIRLTAPGRVVTIQRGILWLNNGLPYPWTPGQQAALGMDDFIIPLAPTSPTPIPPNPIPGDKSPIEIINEVYATGMYNLATHQGCGQFTEACCTSLHNQHSISWGHIRKFGAQEQYNGHAVDAVMLLNSMPDCDRGIYDIIVGSQEPGAHPALNRVSDPNQSLWYYPA